MRPIFCPIENDLSEKSILKFNFLHFTVSKKEKTMLRCMNGILFPKLFWPTVRRNCSTDIEKLLKFESELQEFGKFLRSLEQFIQSVQFLKQKTFLTCSWRFFRSSTLEQLDLNWKKNNWDLETYRKTNFQKSLPFYCLIKIEKYVAKFICSQKQDHKSLPAKKSKRKLIVPNFW